MHFDPLEGLQGGLPLPRDAQLILRFFDGYCRQGEQRSYRELKVQALGCLLLMQVGAFLQGMDEDARALAAVTGLKPRVAGDPDAPAVLGGFPLYGLDKTLGRRLARAGHSVAIALQYTDKLRRLSEVIRVRMEHPAEAL